MKLCVRDITRLLSSLVLGAGPWFLHAQAAPPAQRPNIIIFHSHDYGQFLHCYGVKTVHTPHFDQLAEQGVRFEHSFCTQPGCSPSRASLFTGRYPHSNGVMGLTHGNFAWDLCPGEKHLAQFLAEAGYATVGIGEIHETRSGAARLGYQKYIKGSKATPGTTAGLAELKRLAAGKQPFYLYAGFADTHRQRFPEGSGPMSGLIAFPGPHLQPDDSLGVEVPPYLRDTPGAREELAGLQGAMRHLDQELGRWLEALHDLGLESNTLMVVTTDHGIAMPRAKCSVYDPGIQVALLLRYAGRPGWCGGIVRKEMVSNIDVLPTILELVGIPIPANVQGRSFAPLLDGRPYTPNREIFGELTYHGYYDPVRCIRTETHKLIANFSTAPSFMDPSQQWRPKSDPVVPENPAAAFHPYLELYDLTADPWERVNLADNPQYAAMRDQLAARLYRHMVQTDDPLLEGAVTSPQHRRTMEDLRAAAGNQPQAAEPPAAPATKPNILFILVDDYGIKDVGIEGSTFYETPNIDRLAHSGLRFTQGYAACQVCSPSRASILTGQYPPRHGITDYIGAATGDTFAKRRGVMLSVPDYAHHLSKEEFTLAQALKQAGYATFFAGKWHLGSKGFWPEDFGFDINKGGWDAGSPTGGYFAPWKNPNLPNGPRGQSLTQRLATETISFIQEHRQGPFLAYLSFYAVHSPIQTTKPLWEKYRAKAAVRPDPGQRFRIDRTLPVRQVQDNPIYAGLIENMDTAVGRVLTCLHELGLETNTIVILTGDNGGVSSGDGYSSSMLPYRGGKGRQWEGGLRVPFYIRAPGLTQPGSTCDTPVSGIDFYPTLLGLAGVALPPQQRLDGVSLVPLLKGGAIGDRPLFWHYPHYGNQGGEPSSIIRQDGWKLIHYLEDNRNELYHLPDDIGEQHDLAAQQPARTARLWAELQAWLKDTGATFPQPYAGYDPASAAKLRQEHEDLKARLEEEHADYLKPDWEPNPTWWKSLATND